MPSCTNAKRLSPHPELQLLRHFLFSEGGGTMESTYNRSLQADQRVMVMAVVVVMAVVEALGTLLP